MIRSLITAAVLALAASSALAAPAVHVEADDQAQQEVVSTAGVDFNDPQQVAAFYKKLRAASARVCRFDGASCKNRALATAVRQADREQLTALYNGRVSGATQVAESPTANTARR